MNSQKKIKPYNPFNGEEFNDGAVWELDHKLITGEITLEEYLKKIEEI